MIIVLLGTNQESWPLCQKGRGHFFLPKAALTSEDVTVPLREPKA
jgi:hypothetical protein